MSSSVSDVKVASLAAGFTIGFGFLTVWEAIKQTRANRNPLRSTYIYMIWGEIVANLAIGIVGWLFLDGVFGATVPVLFVILFLWVFEIQLLMQIIINRIAPIAERRGTTTKLKWGTAMIITAVNIAVFCIWIPSHLNPPVSQIFVDINKYWDRISKVIILIVDAGLNWYFLRTVKIRLVNHHGLVKYSPLVKFNARLMVISILMDVMLIGLMSLPNQVVYIQFHPVAYMVKLNIEMSMASLIVRLAKNSGNSDAQISSSDPHSHPQSGVGIAQKVEYKRSLKLQSIRVARKSTTVKDFDTSGMGIERRIDFEMSVENNDSDSTNPPSRSSPSISKDKYFEGDEIPLTVNGSREVE